MGLRWMLAVVPFVVACGGEAATNNLHNEVGPSDGEGDASVDGGVADASVRKDSGTTPATGSDAGSWAVEDPSEFDPDAACAASAVAAEQVLVEQQVEVQVPYQVPVQVAVQVPVQVAVQVPVQVEVKTPVQVQAPVALYVMFDRSGSMGNNILLHGTGQWTPAVTAMKSFVNDADSAGMDIALGYFPSDNGQCGGSGYSTPKVAMGKLPGNATAINNSLNGTTPDGIGTPIEGALNGATQYCKQFQASHPNEKCVAVLVTDGKPEISCSTSETTIVNIAKNAWTNDKVRTFAVGLSGADFGLLDKIATAGGAADCDTATSRFSCDVSSGADKLNVALNKIRDTVTEYVTEYKTEYKTEYQTQYKTEYKTEYQTQYKTEYKTETKTETRPLACTWNMPQPKDGVSVDTSKVNVKVSGGTQSVSLGYVPALESCKVGGWYFDNVSTPTQIIACPDTCTAITAAGATDVQIQLGCETQILVI